MGKINLVKNLYKLLTKKKKEKKEKKKKRKKGKEKRSDAQNPLSVVLTGDNNHHSVICTIS